MEAHVNNIRLISNKTSSCKRREMRIRRNWQV